MDEAFYNTSFQYDRNMQDVQTLLNTSALGFQTVGVAPDSVTRLLSILNAQGVPYLVPSYVPQRVLDRGSFLGSFDFVPQNSTRGSTMTATLSGNLSHTSPVANGSSGLFTPSRDGMRENWGLSSQLRHSGQTGFRKGC